MPLPWFRMDSNIGSHDKIQRLLLADPSPQRWRAFTSYTVAIGYAAGAGTDGRVPAYALATVYGTKTTAGLLVAHGLWEPTLGGWEIHNYADRQETSEITRAKSEAAARAARIRWHGHPNGTHQ